MKKAILVLICLPLFACQPQPGGEAHNTAVVQGLYDAFAAGDVESVLAAMNPQIVWNEAENFPYADNNPYIGPQAVAEGVFTRIGAEWEYWNLTIERLVESDADVIAFGRYSAKHRETGKSINAQFVHHWVIEGDQAISFQQYADTAQVLAAME